MGKAKYQLLERLRDEEYAALEADIAKRGVLVAVEVDENGDTLDGHHRQEIADRLGKPYKTITRKFKTEGEKREHVIKLNLARRHLEPWQWGQAFKMLLEERGVKRGQGSSEQKKREQSATVADVSRELGVPERTARERMKAHDAYEKLSARAKTQVVKGAKTLADAKREAKAKKTRAALENIQAKKAKAVAGVYDVIVIDPPWPMKKIERDCRPNQPAELDYPTMTEDELAAIKVPATKDCHVWVWTTHRFLPMAFRLLEAWKFKYVCTFVWHKPGGFQPVGLPQYNTEFCLYARKGTPTFLDTKGFSTLIAGKRRGHSVKPEEFYDTVKRVTGGRRLDMFNRRTIKGFDGWGQEA